MLRFINVTMTNPTYIPRPADLDPETEAAHAFAAASAALSDGPAPEGPAEVVFNLCASLAHALRAGEAKRSVGWTPELEALYHRTRAELDAWRLAAGCADWVLVSDWTGEVIACAEAEDLLHSLRARLLELASACDGREARDARRRLELAA
jgi:hypothetical protein